VLERANLTNLTPCQLTLCLGFLMDKNKLVESGEKKMFLLQIFLGVH
jgi:hypothetical protein